MLISSEIVIVTFGFIAMALSATTTIKTGVKELHKRNTEVQVLKYHDDRNVDGSYDFNYELSDGQSRQEKGSFRDGKDANGSDIKVLSVTGSYSFVSPDGVTFQVYYTADERGFRIERMTAAESITKSDTGIEIKKDDDETTVEIEAITTTESTSTAT